MHASKHSTTEFYIQPSLIFLIVKKDFVYPKAALNSKPIVPPIPSVGFMGKHLTGFSFFGFETCLFVQPWLSWISIDWAGSELSDQPAYYSRVPRL